MFAAIFALLNSLIVKIIGSSHQPAVAKTIETDIAVSVLPVLENATTAYVSNAITKTTKV